MDEGREGGFSSWGRRDKAFEPIKGGGEPILRDNRRKGKISLLRNIRLVVSPASAAGPRRGRKEEPLAVRGIARERTRSFPKIGRKEEAMLSSGGSMKGKLLSLVRRGREAACVILEEG